MSTEARTYLESFVNILGNDFNAVLCWDFHKAPQCFRDLSDHGGDEDFLVIVPPKVKDTYLHSRLHDNLMCASPSTHPVETSFGEFNVLIFAHA